VSRDLRSALPELRPIGSPNFLSDPDFFLDQLRPSGLLQPPVEAPPAPDWSFSSNGELWDAVLGERVRTSRVVSLRGFYLSEWIPRSPGLFHTPVGAEHRSRAMSQIIEQPYAPDLEWIDHADVYKFEREVYSEEGAFKYMRIFDPYGKVQMLRGGVGCIRLNRHDMDGEPCWLMSASSTFTAHEGFPLAVPHDLYQQVIESVARDGVMPCGSIIGRLRRVPDFLGDLYAWPDVPPVFLQVEHISRGNAPHDDLSSKAMVSVAVSFESRSAQLGPPGMVYATYVTFFPGIKGSLQLRRDWLRDRYVGEWYQGEVISDFDEQVPRFGDVPLGLPRVFEGTVDADQLARPIRQNVAISQALDRYWRTLPV
jgi:hypothetical protein